MLREHCKPSKYVCLSHCWGPPEKRPIITTSNTISAFQGGISYDRLSKTFQHAVDICRRLDVNYIWIDSLCIIQDSAEDWREESVKMGSIYQNATFTIAASKSEDGNKGCYSSIDEAATCSELIPDTDGVRVRPSKEHGFPSSFHARVTHIEDELPLLTRGWVYQEMRLSRRILHFCHGEVVWQCRQLTGEVSTGYHTENAPRNPMDAVPRSISGSTMDWQGVVYNYSSLLLTYPTDRLPALAAIAEQTIKLRDPADRYLAGLWEKSLLLDLQWFRSDRNVDGGGHYKGKRIALKGIPSWSWASIDARVMWKNYDLDAGDIFSASKLVSVDCEANGPIILGNYRIARLVFAVPVLKCSLAGLYKGRITDDGVGAGDHIQVEWFQPDYEHDAPGPGHLHRESMVSLLPLAIIETGICSFCHCLVLLERSEVGTRVCYERIGFVRLEDPIQMKIFMSNAGNLRNQEDKSKYFDDAKKRFEEFFLSLPRSEIVLI